MDNFAYDRYDNRTAGLNEKPFKTVQSWKTPKTHPTDAQNDIITGLDKAAETSFQDSLSHAMAYAPTHNPPPESNGYQFGDVIDVVNPLHHLPVIGTLYRKLTGDEIHPASQIIGGAIFGGPMGFVGGTANAVSRIQTGKDITDHAIQFTGLSDQPSSAAKTMTSQSTQDHIGSDSGTIDETNSDRDTTIAFIDLSQPIKKEPITRFEIGKLNS